MQKDYQNPKTTADISKRNWLDKYTGREGLLPSQLDKCLIDEKQIIFIITKTDKTLVYASSDKFKYKVKLSLLKEEFPTETFVSNAFDGKTFEVIND